MSRSLNFEKSQVSPSGEENRLSMIVPSDKSKRFQDNYYLKYIHQQNKRLLQNQKEALERFIPEQEAEKNSFGERFKVYMEKLNQ